MKLYVDLETLQLIEGPGFRNPVTSLRFKRGDAALLEVAFLEGGSTPVSIGDPLTLEIQFGIKPRSRYDIGYLVFNATWTMPALDAENPLYQCSPSFNTEELNSALGVGSATGTELSEITLMGEITWREGTGEPTSTRTFLVVVENDVNRGTEGSPTQLPTPDDWLDQRGVRFDREQALTSAQQLAARENIGAASTDAVGESGFTIHSVTHIQRISGVRGDGVTPIAPGDTVMVTDDGNRIMTYLGNITPASMQGITVYHASDPGEVNGPFEYQGIMVNGAATFTRSPGSYIDTSNGPWEFVGFGGSYSSDTSEDHPADSDWSSEEFTVTRNPHATPTNWRNSVFVAGTDAQKRAIPFCPAGQEVVVSGEGGRIERFLGPTITDNAHWLVLRNTVHLLFRDGAGLGPGAGDEASINGVELFTTTHAVDCGWIDPMELPIEGWFGMQHPNAGYGINSEDPVLGAGMDYYDGDGWSLSSLPFVTPPRSRITIFYS